MIRVWPTQNKPWLRLDNSSRALYWHVSVGVASDVIVDTDPAGLFRRADAALYVAKRAGRDQVALLESYDDSLLPRAGSTIHTSPTRVRLSPAATPQQPARIT